MKRKININTIIETGIYMEQQNEELKLLKEKLKNDILKIKDSYKGKDADIIIQKYMNRADELNTIISNFEYYANYFQNLSGKYNDTLNNAIKTMSVTSLDSITNDDIANSVINLTL